jgi:predicted dehydrogenase
LDLRIVLDVKKGKVLSCMDTKPVTLAIIGYGYWGPKLLRNFVEVPGCRVKYVCDTSQARLKQAAAKFQNIKPACSIQDVFEDSEVDGVVVATPISTHYDISRLALENGKHVFVEKPLAADSISAENLIDLAAAQQLVLMVGHTFKYSPPVLKIKEIIDSGELGHIYYISSSRVNLGLHQPDASVIWDLAPHDFSIIFFWLNEEPIHVNAFGKACIKSDMPDVAFINLAFDSGAVAEVHLSWLSPVKLRRTVIVGSKKMLTYDDTESVEKVKVFDHGVNFIEPTSYEEFQLNYRSGDILSPHLDTYEPLYAEAKHFVDCVMFGNNPITDGVDGLRVVRALEKAEQSLMKNGNLVEDSKCRLRIA